MAKAINRTTVRYTVNPATTSFYPDLSMFEHTPDEIITAMEELKIRLANSGHDPSTVKFSITTYSDYPDVELIGERPETDEEYEARCAVLNETAKKNQRISKIMRERNCTHNEAYEYIEFLDMKAKFGE